MLIDVHTHVTPPEFPACPDAAAAKRWPCMQCSGGQTTLFSGDKAFRVLDSRSWDAERRIADMARSGVSMQLLSPMPELLSYWLPSGAASLVCDTVNDHIAKMVAGHPAYFRGVGAIPLQDVAEAVRAVKGLRSRYGLDGVEIGSNISGKQLGDPEFEPFFAAAESEGIAIFVHAIHPVAKVADMSAQYVSVVLFPVEIAMAAASLLMAGTLERYPRLRIGFSHGAGALPAMLGRLDQGWKRADGFGGRIEIQPSVTARSMFIDGNVYDPVLLRHLACEVAPGRVFAGSDYPYKIMEENIRGLIDRACFSDESRNSIEHGAALAFLNASA